MLGDIYKTSTGEQGLCSMSVDALFSRVTADAERSYAIKASYLEIYNEQVKDLLSPMSGKTGGLGLMIVEDPIRGVTVPELTEYTVTNSRELLQLVLKGNEKRTMASTSVNQFSSRSHAILQIMLEYRNRLRSAVEEITMSKLCMVDLAGSERAASTENRGLRMFEGGKINKSLLALGNCINILSDRARASASFVPYRDSKLTRLLKDSLGGNTKTVMIACVSPAGNCYEETVNTLKYAERAKRIKKKIRKNVREVEVDIAKYKEIIDSLRSEITSLREQLQNQQGREEGQSQVKQSAPTAPVVSIVPKVDSNVNSASVFALAAAPEKASTVIMGENVSSVVISRPAATRRTADEEGKVRGSAEIDALNEEIQRTKELKEKYREELPRDNEDVRQSLQFSQSSILDDDTYLNKLSQELMTKYEEHYEMKESVQELTELNTKNQTLIRDHKRDLDGMIEDQRKKRTSGQDTAGVDTLIKRKLEDIELLQKTCESNEEIRREIERSLEENGQIQQKYLGLVIKLQSHKKKDILELQIAVRTLRLEKMDLMMQNLEMKKVTRLAEMEREAREKEMAQMRAELEAVREQLKQKEMQLQTSKSQVVKQSQELEHLKHFKELYLSMVQNASPAPSAPARTSVRSERPPVDSSRRSDPKDSSMGYIKVTFKKSAEKRTVGTVHLAKSPSPRTDGKLSQPASSVPNLTNVRANLRNPVPPAVSSGRSTPNNQPLVVEDDGRFGGEVLRPDLAGKRPNKRYDRKPENEEDKRDDGDNSFFSVSSVTMNYNDVSNSDLEFMDNCVTALDRRNSSKPVGSPLTAPQPISARKSEKPKQKNAPRPLVEKEIGRGKKQPVIPSPRQPHVFAQSTKDLPKKPAGREKRETVVIRPVPASNGKGKGIVSTRCQNSNFAAQRLTAGKKQDHQRSESLQCRIAKIAARESGKRIEVGSGFFSNVSENYSQTISQLNPVARPAQSINYTPVLGRSSSFKEKTVNRLHLKVGSITVKPVPPVVPRSEERKNLERFCREGREDKKGTAVVSDFPQVICQRKSMTDNEMCDVAAEIRKSVGKPQTGTLSHEIDELIKKQKESLKADFDKAKEQEDAGILKAGQNMSIGVAGAHGDMDEGVDCDVDDAVRKAT